MMSAFRPRAEVAKQGLELPLLATSGHRGFVYSTFLSRLRTGQILSELPGTRLGAVVVSDKDIYRSAKLLIDQHGDDAPIFAAVQANKRTEAGECRGTNPWWSVRRGGRRSGY